jgi:hypothetical protein
MNLMKFATIVAILMFVCGCICQPGTETGTASSADSNEPQTGANDNAVTPTTLKSTVTTLKATVTTQAASGGILSDLSAAISAGVGYKCTYTYQDITTESFVKGKKFLSKSNVNGQTGNALSDGVWMYSWSDGQQQGFKFNLADMQKNAQATQGGQKTPSMDEIAQSASHVQCVPATLIDSQFNPPSDVEFKDMGEMLKQIQAMQKGGKMDPEALKALQDAAGGE